MSNFPLADKAGQDAQENWKECVVKEDGPGVVRVNVAKLDQDRKGVLRKEFLDDLRYDFRSGTPHVRRRAALEMEVLDKLENGTWGKSFVHEHPALLIDEDGDTFSPIPGRASHSRALGAELPDIVAFRKVATPAFDDSQMTTGADRRDVAKKLQHARENPQQSGVQQEGAHYMTGEKVGPGPRPL